MPLENNAIRTLTMHCTGVCATGVCATGVCATGVCATGVCGLQTPPGSLATRWQ